MPEEGGDYSYTLGATTTVKHNSAIVVAVRQYSTRQYPNDFTPGSSTGLVGTATTGVAAAQQLINRYETDMDQKTLGEVLGVVDIVNKELAADKFSCTTDVLGNCVDDPMYILGAVYDQTLAVACTFAQGGSWDGTTPYTVDNTGANRCSIDAPDDIPSSGNTNQPSGVSSSGSIPAFTSATMLHIQLPPKDTPQFYVYGIATYQHAPTGGTISPETGTITGDSSSNGKVSRRLRDTKQVRKAFDMVTTTLDGAPITQVIDQIHYAAQM
jgi:hypothetical protein